MSEWLPSAESIQDAIHVIVVLLFMLGGILVGAACGHFWGRHRILHLGPFAYGLLFEPIAFGDFRLHGVTGAIYGLVFYGMTWFQIWGDRAREQQSQADNAARRAWRFDVALTEIKGEVEAASAGRYARVRVEPNNRLDSVLVVVDVPNSNSQADNVAVAAEIKAIIENELPAEDGPAWKIFLRRRGWVVYSLSSLAKSGR